MALGRAVVSDWQPVPGAYNGECTVRKSRKYKSKLLGTMYLVEGTGAQDWYGYR